MFLAPSEPYAMFSSFGVSHLPTKLVLMNDQGCSLQSCITFVYGKKIWLFL